MRCLKLLLVLSVFPLLIGCASARQFVAMPDQKVKVENPQKGRVYVIRPSSLGSGIKMTIKDGDTVIGKTSPKSYLSWERYPGPMTITCDSENMSELSFDVEAGEVYYVLQRVKMGAVMHARNELEQIDETQAQDYLKKCKPAQH